MVYTVVTGSSVRVGMSCVVVVVPVVAAGGVGVIMELVVLMGAGVLGLSVVVEAFDILLYNKQWLH